MSHPQSTDERIRLYLNRLELTVNLKRPLGAGTDGDVWESSRDTAIKVLKYEVGYANERDSYLRLRDFGVTNEIAGFWVPNLVDYDDDLWIVEMDMMQSPPYVIDFAKVRIDRPPDFSDEVIEEQNRRGDEEFGRNWSKVKLLLDELESYQIYYLDPRPGNITFPDMP